MRKSQTPILIEDNKFHTTSDTPKPFLSKSSKSTPSYQKKIACVCFSENGKKCVDPGCILFSSNASHSSSISSISAHLSPKPNETHLKSTLSCDSCTTFISRCPFESVHSDTDENISNEILPDFSPCTSKLSLSTEAKKRKYYLAADSVVNATVKNSTTHTALFSTSSSEKIHSSSILIRLFSLQIIKGFISFLQLPYRFYQSLCCQETTLGHAVHSFTQQHKENDSYPKKNCVKDMAFLCEKSCTRSESPRFHYLGSFPLPNPNDPPTLGCELSVTPTLKYFLPIYKWLRMILTSTTRLSVTSVLTCFFSCCSCICLMFFVFLDSSPMLDQYLS